MFSVNETRLMLENQISHRTNKAVISISLPLRQWPLQPLLFLRQLAALFSVIVSYYLVS